jgi:hypothetical protein
MAQARDLESLSSHELHDLAVRKARHRLDVEFFWELLRAIPAAEAMEGDEYRSARDMTQISSLVSDALGSGEGEVADELRPLYIDYLTKHGYPGDEADQHDGR